MLQYQIDTTIDPARGAAGRVAGHGYLWMKKVTGFNPKHHCAKCLTGSYENNFGLKAPVDQWVDLPGYEEGDVVYVCGVSRPYNWNRNRHLAARVKAGAWCYVKLFNGQTVMLRNAEAIPFDARAAQDLFRDKGPEFVTCRNFQFGAQLFCERV